MPPGRESGVGLPPGGQPPALRHGASKGKGPVLLSQGNGRQQADKGEHMGMGYGNQRRGMALLLALVAVLLISALLSGILLLTVSHLGLSGANSAYANALSLAEAGVNWELWKISRDVAQADQTDTTVEFPAGSGRTFTVRVQASETGGAWAPPDDLWVVSTGTVHGASRTVRVHAAGEGPNGDYALFGIDTLNMGGNLTVVGASGSNGVVDVNGNPNLEGNFWYCGSGTGDITPDDPRVTGDVCQSPIPEYFPTVNDLANLRVKDRWGVTTDEGVDYFSTHNDNATICDAAGNPIGVKAGTIDWKQQNIAVAGATLWDGTPVPVALQGKSIVVLLSGDYYFTSLRVTGSDYLLIDDANGPVNIWLGPESGGGQPDVLTGNCQFTGSTDGAASNFHLYEGSHRDLVMEGTTDFYGNVYAYNGPGNSGDYWGSIIFRGDCNIVGSVIGYDVTKVSGSAVITYPSGGGGPGEGIPGDLILYYGFLGGWEELNGL
jgi:hypothetical protein